MTQVIQRSGGTYHQCGECKLLYGKKKLAEECEAWCREHKTCNIEITTHAVALPGDNNVLSKQEKKTTKRDERLAERAHAERKRKFSKFVKRGAIAVASLTVFGLLGWYIATRPSVSEGGIISQSGLHWHPELSIIIQGKKQEIPSDIGLGIVEQYIHTHDATGQIHLEFQGLVRRDDIRLGQFFKIWGKTFNRNQILDFVNGPGGTVKMFVNDQSNDQFENYVMMDKDKIEIRYER